MHLFICYSLAVCWQVRREGEEEGRGWGTVLFYLVFFQDAPFYLLFISNVLAGERRGWGVTVKTVEHILQLPKL